LFFYWATTTAAVIKSANTVLFIFGKNGSRNIDSLYRAAVARLFFLRAKIEDTLFGVGLRIENSEKQKNIYTIFPLLKSFLMLNERKIRHFFLKILALF